MSSLILALLLAGAADPQQQAGVPALTLQQLFDKATKAAADGECAEAVATFAQIEKNPKAMASATVRAAIDVRKGYCLITLEQVEEGEAAIRRGLPVLAAKGGSFEEEVLQAHLALGKIAVLRFDYTTAAAEFRIALDSSTGDRRIKPLLALSQVLMFDQDGEALRYATEARSLIVANPKADPGAVAAVQSLYARTLLNAGRAQEAYAELKNSLRKQGGLSLKVDSAGLATRSDLAIAAWMNRDFESARNYLAYTGAGRFRDSPFGRATEMDPPPCGEATGLKPDDVAIVEFSLAEDGHVEGVLPVYTLAGRKAALAFSRAVAGWSWTAETAKSVPLFFRRATRIELRCSNGGDNPSLIQPLAATFADWIAGQGVAEGADKDEPDAKALPAQQAALATARAKGDRAAVLAAAVAIGRNSVAGQDQRKAMLGEAVVLADALAAPIPARAFLAIEQASVSSHDGGYVQRLRALLARPEFQQDPLAAATLRLLVALPRSRRGVPGDADTLLAQVIAAPALPDRHPLKVAALLQRANLAAAKGRVEEAQQAFAGTGLTSKQCALLGLKPAVRSYGNTDQFPDTASRFGFEGWVRSEFDVAPDGHTLSPRVVSAYPAFVFDEAGIGVAKGLRYTSSYRPEEGAACTAQNMTIAFQQFGR
ncbi:hypothetical protein [Sphingomonas elodea]|uniref:hypothetical protein n=1 Tax=Sphingomonas elodea TaxID=179878 RepID=UPI000263044D|nr:hypothetical protein [Sphingomonas elodea]